MTTKWGLRTLEQYQRDVVAGLREAAARGESLTVRAQGWPLYNAARRAFGSWTAALDAAGVERTTSTDAASGLRYLDAISANQLEGLPSYIRQRQVLGGAFLELVASNARAAGDRGVGDVSPGELAVAFRVVLAAADELLASAEAEAS